MKLIKLEWDSNFWNRDVYKADIKDVVLSKDDFKEYVNSRTTVYLSSNIRQPLLEEAGVLLADQKVTYWKKLDLNNTETVDSKIVEYSGALTDDLKELALLSGHQSRFKIDPVLNHKFNELYIMWMAKSLTKELANNVFVYQDNGIFGCVTIKKKADTGVIGLIAVSEKRMGKSIGSSLIKKAEQWYLQNGLVNAEVVTQLQNLQACKFYEKMGYSIANVSYIYQLHL